VGTDRTAGAEMLGEERIDGAAERNVDGEAERNEGEALTLGDDGRNDGEDVTVGDERIVMSRDGRNAGTDERDGPDERPGDIALGADGLEGLETLGWYCGLAAEREGIELVFGLDSMPECGTSEALAGPRYAGPGLPATSGRTYVGPTAPAATEVRPKAGRLAAVAGTALLGNA
jgi:hypothetical protein